MTQEWGASNLRYDGIRPPTSMSVHGFWINKTAREAKGLGKNEAVEIEAEVTSIAGTLFFILALHVCVNAWNEGACDLNVRCMLRVQGVLAQSA